jgi:hypothetical protein
LLDLLHPFVVDALPDAGAPTMKELLDTDRVNFLVWRFVVFTLPPRLNLAKGSQPSERSDR